VTPTSETLPSVEKPAAVRSEVDASEVDVIKTDASSETIGELVLEPSDASGSALKNHISPRAIDHTSPTSPCSTKSADDNGEQKLSTPGAASSGYGSAVLTQTTSSDDLLGDHVASDDINGDRSSVAHANSMVVTAEVNIIDAAVPIDLDSPLKPTTPYADEPTVPTASTDVSILDSSALNTVVPVNSESEVHQSSQERSTLSSGATSNPESNAKTGSENVEEAEPSEDQSLDVVKQSDTVADEDNDEKDNVTETSCSDSHAVESVTDLPSDICHNTSSMEHADFDAKIADEAGLTDSLTKPQSTDKSNVKATSTSGSVKALYQPISMPPEMTVIEDEKMDITTLGTNNYIILCFDWWFNKG